MGVSSDVLIQDPADVKTLFAHACAAVGLPPDARHHVIDFGDARMLQAAPHQDAEALVAVHYAVDGGLYPDMDSDETLSPDGYALVTFGISGGVDHDAAWLRHHRIVVDRFGPWLTDQGLCWSWRYDGGLWEAVFLRRPNDTPPV